MRATPNEADRAMDRYASGDDATFGAVYDHVAPRLLAYLRRSLRDTAQVEELTHATLVHIHRARGSFVNGAPLIPWALAIARRLMIDRFRRHTSDVALVRAVASTTGPDTSVEARALASHLERALAEIPERQRVAFRMLRVEGLTSAEAAALLATTEASVKRRAQRAYETLEERLSARSALTRLAARGGRGQRPRPARPSTSP